MLLRRQFCVGCLLLGTGCATWNVERKDFHLPQPQLPVDSILCETAFVQWNLQDADVSDATQGLDEHVLPPEVRRRLAENGLRVGVIDGQLPQHVREKLSATADPAAALTSPNLPVGEEILSRREQRQCRSNVREDLEILSQSPSSMTVLVNEDGHVRAEKFEQPRGFLAATAFSNEDGRVRVEIVPAFDFGDMKQRVVGTPGGFRYDARRDQRMFDGLSFSTSLTPSQTLVITSTPEQKGLGATFFANRFSSDNERLVLLMRFSRSKQASLFSTDSSQSSLVTPLE